VRSTEGFRGTEHRLRGGAAEVREVTHHESGEIGILLDPEALMSDLLQAMGSRLNVRDLAVESVTRHDIYVQTVATAADTETEEVPA